MPSDLSPAWPHGSLERALPDIYFVVGTNKTHHAGVDIQTSRTMVVLRQDDGVTLVNTVRLDDDGLRALDALGKVTTIVRLGAFHGRDDAFYRDRYRAALWALPGATSTDGRDADHALAPGASPLADADVFVFASAKFPEAALLLRREGGVLVTCDAIQNWTAVDPYFSAETGAQFLAGGLIRSPNIPATWLGACEPAAADFDRLLALDFRHLVTAHGPPLLDVAHAAVRERVAEVFGPR